MTKIFTLILFTLALGGSYCLSSIAGTLIIVAISVGLAHLFCRNEKRDDVGIKINYKLFIYFVRLSKEIFFSTMSVCKAILFKRKSDLHPILGEITTDQISDEARVLFGNSITLTPGTITVDILDNKVIVHAINAECLSGSKQLDAKIIKSQG